MSEWQPLSVRSGARPVERVPYEGVPGHLGGALERWLRDVLVDVRGTPIDAMVEVLVVRLRIHAWDAQSFWMELFRGVRDNEELMLDAIDLALCLRSGHPQYGELARQLDFILGLGGSAWIVAVEEHGLRRRVDSTAQDAYESAVEPQEAASDQLREAWTAAFGRHPDASDAWDHAIKAVEAILGPIAAPDDPTVTLGRIINNLRTQQGKWRLRIGTNTTENSGIDALLDMLGLLWPNPDRHGSDTASRPPSLAEAQAVVHLAVTVVQWVRTGVLTRQA